MDISLEKADASFIKTGSGGTGGWRCGAAGDVNGDGFDDFLTGSPYSAQSKSYLILGKALGWSQNMDISNADVSFIQEEANDWVGRSVSGTGDVNWDGYDDFLIGAPGNDGQCYLFLGKRSGWSKEISLSDADASFIGNGGWIGDSVVRCGDVNGDGYDDILMGAHKSSGEKGETYLFLGKSSGWSIDISLSSADASFTGEYVGDHSGIAIGGGGDINGDGYDDILIGADGNDDGSDYGGQTYLIFPDHNTPPTTITSVEAYSDPAFTHEITSASPLDRIFIQLHAQDADPTRANIALVNVTSSGRPQRGFTLRLRETDDNSGIYRGNITIANRTHKRYRWINATDGGWVNIYSRTDSAKFVNLTIGPTIEIIPKLYNEYVSEDSFYTKQFDVSGIAPDAWSFDSDAEWLTWNSGTREIYGTPDNSDVGDFWVNVSAEKGPVSDYLNFTLTVNNTPPEITTDDVLLIEQDSHYLVDYDSTDDGKGVVTWNIATNASWLHFNATTGMLNGTPSNDDVGSYDVNVSVDDGNGGTDFSTFLLTVTDVNDPPVLSNGSVTPNVGNISTNFTFSVVFTDIDDMPPVEIRVNINGTPHDMTGETETGFRTGVNYSYTTTLPKGVSEYYFTASDGFIETRLPLTGELATPEVMPLPPNITEIIRPTLDLVEPANGTTINTTNVSLEWNCENPNSGILLTFDLYFSDDEDDVRDRDASALYQSDIVDPYHNITSLEDGKTYYWLVTANIYGIADPFPGSLWSFTVEKGFEAVHDVRLSFDMDRVEIVLGESAEINLTVSNLGNLPEKVIIEITGDLANSVAFSPIVELAPGTQKNVMITIFTKPQMGFTTFYLNVKAGFSDMETEARLEVELVEKEENGGHTESLGSSYSAYLWLAVIAVILIAVIIVIFLVMRSRRRKQIDDGEEVTAEIEHVPSSGIKGEIPTAQIVTQQMEDRRIAGAIHHGYVRREPLMRGPVETLPGVQPSAGNPAFDSDQYQITSFQSPPPSPVMGHDVGGTTTMPYATAPVRPAPEINVPTGQLPSNVPVQQPQLPQTTTHELDVPTVTRTVPVPGKPVSPPLPLQTSDGAADPGVVVPHGVPTVSEPIQQPKLPPAQVPPFQKEVLPAPDVRTPPPP